MPLPINFLMLNALYLNSVNYFLKSKINHFLKQPDRLSDDFAS